MPKVSTVLIAVVSILIGIGLVVLASVSGVRGISAFNDSQYYIKRQLIWLVLAVIAGIFTAKFDYHLWRKWVIPISVASIILLILVLIPGIGREIGGSRRWLRLGPVSFQPSELGKMAAIIAIASWIAQMGRRVARFQEGFVIPAAILGLFVVLIFAEPDYGTTVLTGVVGMVIMFVGGSRSRYLFPAAAVGMSVISVAIMHNEVRLGRIMAFIDPAANPDVAYHLAQSKTSFMHGGILGVGYGNSIQKQLYLPEAHTDFLFAVLAEELGMLGVLVVIL
ncbi:MAG: FtsW/RodA/SpoVE family cell cycle protein, partial [Kiritimatiellae bacterium]|nr:FtsW/RodA/SpoVE family cell cycle protein [Kiritimatiellia bacterium]